jgi:putative holliday junction resolvase
MSQATICPLAELSTLVHPPMRLAALDIGTKTIGIALSTPDWQIATALTTIQRTKWANDLKALEKNLSGYGVGGIIVGLPMNMDNTLGPRAQGVQQVIYNLIKADLPWMSGVAIAFTDERLTTVGVSDLTSHLSLKHAKTKGALDALAAQDILERSLKTLRPL